MHDCKFESEIKSLQSEIVALMHHVTGGMNVDGSRTKSLTEFIQDENREIKEHLNRKLNDTEKVFVGRIDKVEQKQTDTEKAVKTVCNIVTITTVIGAIMVSGLYIKEVVGFDLPTITVALPTIGAGVLVGIKLLLTIK